MVERKDGASPPNDSQASRDADAHASHAEKARPSSKKKTAREAVEPPQAAPRAASSARGTNAPPEIAAKAATAPRRVNLIRQFELVERVKAYDPQADEDLLDRAYVFAMKAHGDQTRKSGDPYFSHPLAVAGILTDLRADPATVATALLHDVVEDTDTTIEDIRKLFGAEIAHLVEGVTKLSEIEAKGVASRAAENFRKFVVAMADDVRVLLVKLADRLHNMRTLEHHVDPEKRRKIAIETMEIFAPLAGRIGVQRFRDELEDLAFKEISGPAFEMITSRLEELRASAVSGVIEVRQEIQKKLDSAGLRAEVYSREKRAYSIWRKMTGKNVGFEELADIFAFRIILEDVEACYRALGLIHTGWRMIPSEFDDYISAPKPNGYRSIHTVVIGPPRGDGGRQKIEFQIRTREMHEAAERGVAAHWQYKDKNVESRSSVEIVGEYDPYETPRKLVEMYQLGEDLDEVLRYAKIELFQDQVFCFTPKGMVVALPQGSSALDFAYALHTDIGDSCVGAKVNGNLAPLRTALKNGDVVEIVRGPDAPPPAEWEQIAMTGRARAAIRRRIKKMRHAEQAALGRNIAESFFERAKLEFSTKAVRAALAKFGEKSVDDLLARVGSGEIRVDDLIEAAYPGASHEAAAEFKPAGVKPFRPRVAIEGLPPGVPVRMAPCCSPLPGERIVGIRDTDGSIQVHEISCERLALDDPPQDRWLDLRWRRDTEETSYFAQIVVTVNNEVGVLSEVANVIARYGVSIANIRLQNRGQGFVELVVDVEVTDARQLANLLGGLKASRSVVAAERREAQES